MQIPRFWARASCEARKANGEQLQLKCWGWSVDHLSDAHVNAQAALQRLAERVRQGAELPSHYGYGTRALREEIIREDFGDAAVITRNSYGALIMNTSRMLFIDVDN